MKTKFQLLISENKVVIFFLILSSRDRSLRTAAL